MDKKNSSEEAINMLAKHPADKMIAETVMEWVRNGGIESNQNENKETSAKENAHKEKLLALELANLKEIIDVKEFELIYGFSKETQKGYRSRLNNPIPFIQKKDKSKIMYKKSEVIKWLGGKKR